MTALHWATLQGHDSVVELLVADPNVDVNIRKASVSTHLILIKHADRFPSGRIHGTALCSDFQQHNHTEKHFDFQQAGSKST